MAGKSVSLGIVIKEGKDGLKKLTLDADGLRKVMAENIRVAKAFEDKAFKFAAIITGISQANDALRQLPSSLLSVTEESNLFEKSMREANTMAGKDGAGFGNSVELKAEVCKVAEVAYCSCTVISEVIKMAECIVSRLVL